MQTQQHSQNVGLAEIKNPKPEFEDQIAVSFLFGTVGKRGLMECAE